MLRLYRFSEKDTAEGIKSLCVTRAIKAYCSVFSDTLFQFRMPFQVRCEACRHDIAVGDDVYVLAHDTPDLFFKDPVVRTTQDQCVDIFFEQRGHIRADELVRLFGVLLSRFDEWHKQGARLLKDFDGAIDFRYLARERARTHGALGRHDAYAFCARAR